MTLSNVLVTLPNSSKISCNDQQGHKLVRFDIIIFIYNWHERLHSKKSKTEIKKQEREEKGRKRVEEICQDEREKIREEERRKIMK